MKIAKLTINNSFENQELNNINLDLCFEINYWFYFLLFKKKLESLMQF